MSLEGRPPRFRGLFYLVALTVVGDHQSVSFSGHGMTGIFSPACSWVQSPRKRHTPFSRNE